MPATEQTWRDLKILHVVFGVVALILLLATVIMLTVDHNRPWKKYQRTFRALETWTAAARVDAEDTRAFAEKANELEDALAAVRRADLNPDLIGAFLAEAEKVPEDAEAAVAVREDVGKLRSEANADERFVLRGDLLQRLRDIVDRAEFRENQLAGTLKLRKAELDKRRADYELAIAEEAPAERQRELLELADAKRAEVNEATLSFQRANTHRKSLNQTLGAINAPENSAAKDLADHRQSLSLLRKVLSDRSPNFGWEDGARTAGTRRVQWPASCGSDLASQTDVEQQLQRCCPV